MGTLIGLEKMLKYTGGFLPDFVYTMGTNTFFGHHHRVHVTQRSHTVKQHPW